MYDLKKSKYHEKLLRWLVRESRLVSESRLVGESRLVFQYHANYRYHSHIRYSLEYVIGEILKNQKKL